VLLVLAAAAALRVPELAVVPSPAADAGSAQPGFGDLVRNRAFLCVVAAAAPILGSHAMHDSFALIAWNAAGISSATGSRLWSESVAAEVIVFLGIGPWLLHRIGPVAGMMIGAVAAAIRWIVMAQTSSVVALAIVEPLHGLTFALLHLSCMRVLVRVVPMSLAATAQASYALGAGAMTALLTLLSGWLYARFGAGGFIAMAALAAASLPPIWALHRMEAAATRP
jgi:PPP family 3-phenylpropionic acid transporter